VAPEITSAYGRVRAIKRAACGLTPLKVSQDWVP